MKSRPNLIYLTNINIILFIISITNFAKIISIGCQMRTIKITIIHVEYMLLNCIAIHKEASAHQISLQLPLKETFAISFKSLFLIIGVSK